MDVLARNNVNLSGGGERAIVFAHGFGCNQNMWRYVVPPFAEKYRVVLFDHVGAGGSDLLAYDDIKYSRLSGYATDLLEICHALKLEKPIFVGHSVASMMGVEASIREPELFSALVLVGPSPCYLNDGDYKGGFSRADIDDLLHFLDSNYLGWSSTMAPVIMGNSTRPELSAELENSFCQTNPEIGKKFARVTFLSDSRADLPKVSVKTLILQCTEDPIAPMAVGEYTQRQIRGSELFVLKATGHCPNLSEPEETVAAIQDYLDRHRL